MPEPASAGEYVACSLYLNPWRLCHGCQPPSLQQCHWKPGCPRLTSHAFLDQGGGHQGMGCLCSVSVYLYQEGHHMRKYEVIRTSCPNHTEKATLPHADLPSHDVRSCISLRDPSTPLPKDGDSGHPIGWLGGRVPWKPCWQ